VSCVVDVWTFVFWHDLCGAQKWCEWRFMDEVCYSCLVLY